MKIDLNMLDTAPIQWNVSLASDLKIIDEAGVTHRAQDSAPVDDSSHRKHRN